MSTRRFVLLREVHPSGWIETFLKTQAAGMTGHPFVHGYPYGQKFWGSRNDDSGPYAAWLDQQPGSNFIPDLATLDALVQSIEVQ